jgi:outer membrane protein
MSGLERCCIMVSRLTRLAFAAAVLTAALPAVAQAQQGPGEDTRFRITLGGGALYAPTYLGSDDYDVDALPLIDIRNDRFFLSTRDGLGGNLLERGSNWKAGPVLKYRFGRDQDDDAALRGLGDVDPAGEAGGFVHYDLRPFRVGAEVRQGFGGHDAVIGDLFASWSTNLSKSLMLTAGPRATVASEDFTQTYFGINAAQATRSGYRAYNADGAYMSYGVGANLTYMLTDSISLGGFAGVDRIAGDAADSPLVDQAGSATQARIGVTLGYTFGR